MTDQIALLELLRQPFPPEAISWLPGSTTKDGAKCMAMAYADLRAYQERLDEVCGLDWSVRYVPWGDERIMCELTIAGVTRSSTGEYDAQDTKNNIEGTVAEAQAFKRAASMFGLGRYLYELPAVWVAFDAASKKISKEGQTELDKRYATWYARKTAPQHRPGATQTHVAPSNGNTTHDSTSRTVDAATGEITDTNPHAGGTGDVLFMPEPANSSSVPTDDELAITATWRGPSDAQVWAIQAGACANKFHATESWMVSVRECGGYSSKNQAAVFAHFARRQLEKLEQREMVAA